MAINLEQVINSRFAVNFLVLLARVIPPRVGYWLSDAIADWIASQRESKLTRAVRANQWIVRGANLDQAALDLAVKETLQNNAHELYNLYHYLRRPEAILKKISFGVQAREVLERSEF